MTCYYPDGSVAEGLFPCNGTAGSVSGCCRVGDVCSTNGFCFSFGQNSLIRRGCTDKTFNSTECPNKCTTGELASADVVMTPCGGYTHFCCGQDDAARNCCTSDNGTVLVAAGTAILSTVTVSATALVTASTCALASTTATSAVNDCQPAKNTVSVGAAAGLGAALGIAVLTALACAIMWGRKAKRVKELEKFENSNLPLQSKPGAMDR